MERVLTEAMCECEAVKEKTAHTNRIGGILMALGIRGVNPHRRDFVQRLDGLVTGTGEPLPAHTKQALAREHERIALTERQIKDIERAGKRDQSGRDAAERAGRRRSNRARWCPSCGIGAPERHWTDQRRATVS